MLEEGYTTIFHPGNEGVTISKPDTLNITLTNYQYSKGARKKVRNFVL